jgi:hypothetical protein
VARERVLPLVAALERDPALRVYRLRATLADVVPLIGDLPDLLKSRPFSAVPRVRQKGRCVGCRGTRQHDPTKLRLG